MSLKNNWKILCLMVVFLFSALPSVIAQSEKSPLEEEYIKIKIPERTVIPFKMPQTIKGNQLIMGQTIELLTTRDIIIDDYVVIKYRAPVLADVTAIEKAGYVSQGGKIGFSVNHVRAIDGTKVYIKSILQNEAEDHMGANIAVSVIICPLFLLAKGEEAEISGGMEFKGYVENDTYIRVRKSDLLSGAEIQKLEEKREIEERNDRQRLEKEREERKKKEASKENKELSSPNDR